MKLRLFLFAATTSLSSCVGLSQVDPYSPMPLPIDQNYVPFSEHELNIIRTPSLPTLYGGREIAKGELDFSVYIGNCTASIVGPKVIMTAGHCRDTGEGATFTLNGVRHTGKCYQHPQYSKGGWLNNDFALCIMNQKIEVSVMASLAPVEMSVGDTVIMQGYGKGSPGGRLNLGRTKIVRSDDMEYTTDDSVKLGPGDSGGGFLKDTADLKAGPFFVVGVNSRASVGGKQSYFNRVNLPRTQVFFKDVANKNNVEICGINLECGQDQPLPPDPPEPPEPPTPPGPTDKCFEEQSFVKMFDVKLSFFKNQLNLCLK